MTFSVIKTHKVTYSVKNSRKNGINGEESQERENDRFH